MAVWKEKIAGIVVKIHNMDHPPPHCHTVLNGRDIKIDLATMSVMNPPPKDLPPGLRRGLLKRHEELLKAWENVMIHPPGSDATWNI
jgi:Domain of unknown function (DUF4160)